LWAETGPDLTLVFDLPSEEGLGRVAARGQASTRFEARDAHFTSNCAAAFLEIARADPARCTVIDARPRADAVEAAVWAAVQKRLEP
jgi:dTMP kinase